MGCKNATIVIALLMGLYAYRLYKPLPENIASRWESTKLFAVLALVDDVATIGSKLGIDSHLNITRSVMEATSSGFNNMPTDAFAVEDTLFDGVKVRLYKPNKPEKDAPAIIFYHGGGFVMCNLEVHDAVLRMIANDLNIFIVSVDYRLAPEHPYPAQLDDCMKATLYFMDNLKKYNINPKRLAVMGDSAGGTLAAAASLKLRGMKNVPQPKLQVLVYPLLQGFDYKLPSFTTNSGKAYGSTRGTASCISRYAGLDDKYIPMIAENRHISPAMKKKYGHLVDRNLLPQKYLKESTADDNSDYDKELSEKLEKFVTDPFVVPLMATDLKGLPSSYIITAEYDGLRDEGMIYAKRLEAQGIKVKLAHYDDAFHAVFNMIQPPIKIESGIRMVKDMVEYMKQNL